MVNQFNVNTIKILHPTYPYSAGMIKRQFISFRQDRLLVLLCGDEYH